MSKDLKSCPFCGSEVELDETLHQLTPLQYFVHCKKCAVESDLFDTEAEAILAWNTRPLEDKLVGALEKILYAFNGNSSLLDEALLEGRKALAAAKEGNDG